MPCRLKKLSVLNLTLNPQSPTLEKLRGHGFVDELRSPFHQSHSGVQVVVHHCNVKSRFPQSTWVAQMSKWRTDAAPKMTSAPKSSLHNLTSLKYVGGGAAEQFPDAACIILLGRIEERNGVYAEKKEARRCLKVFCMNLWEVFNIISLTWPLQRRRHAP